MGNGAQVRVAHMSPDSMAASVDICIAQAGSSTQMPAIAALAYQSVTASATIPAGSYDIYVYTANGGACTGTPLLSKMGVTLTNGQMATLVATGETSSMSDPLALDVLTNLDAAPMMNTDVRIRVAHFGVNAPSAVDVGAAAMGMFNPVFPNVTYGAVDTAVNMAFGFPAPDAGGYIEAPNSTLMMIPVGLALPGATAPLLSTAAPLSLTMGDQYTVYAAGDFAMGATTKPMFVVCDETAAPTAMGLLNCTAVALM